MQAGRGLKFMTSEGEARLGSAAWCGINEAVTQSASLYFSTPNKETTAFILSDKLRSDASEVISDLKEAGFHVAIMSGDRAETVEQAAQELGVSEWRARCQPQEKIVHLQNLAASGHKILMVGDRLNDAPALAAAHASLAPSSAADISQMASDAVFQGAALRPIIDLLATARRAQRMAFENFGIAGL